MKVENWQKVLNQHRLHLRWGEICCSTTCIVVYHLYLTINVHFHIKPCVKSIIIHFHHNSHSCLAVPSFKFINKLSCSENGTFSHTTYFTSCTIHVYAVPVNE